MADAVDSTIILGMNVATTTAEELLKLAKGILATGAAVITGLAARKVVHGRKEETYKHGKQSAKSLMKQCQEMSAAELSETDFKIIDPILKRYGIDYAVAVDKREAVKLPYTVLFKVRDAAVMEIAMRKCVETLEAEQHKRCSAEWSEERQRADPESRVSQLEALKESRKESYTKLSEKTPEKEKGQEVR